MKTKILLVIVILLLLHSAQSFATGMGITSSSSDEDREFSSDRETSGVGFVMDTSLARDRVFNYRLSLVLSDNTAGSSNWTGYEIINDFGFGIIRTKVVRLWLGPRLHFSTYDDDNSIASYAGLLLGLVIGLNINLPGTVSLAFTTGQLRGEYTLSGGNCALICNENVQSSFVNASLIFRFRGDN